MSPRHDGDAPRSVVDDELTLALLDPEQSQSRRAAYLVDFDEVPDQLR